MSEINSKMNKHKDYLLWDSSNESLKLQIEHLRAQTLQNMGMPPRRPNKGYRQTLNSDRGRDNFMMDFENACLQNWAGLPPTGPKRYENPEWAKMIQSQVFPAHSDLDWYDYVEFCQLGGGNEWFQEEEQ